MHRNYEKKELKKNNQYINENKKIEVKYLILSNLEIPSQMIIVINLCKEE